MVCKSNILLGRVIYQAMAKYWPSKMGDPSCRGEDFAFANMMNSYTKMVFSTTLKAAAWHNARVASGHLPQEISALKAMPCKNMIVYGSGQLSGAFIETGLVDEYQIWLHPVILGTGKPFFTPCNCYDQNTLHFKLVSTKRFSSGVILLCYQTIAINENESI